VNGWKVNSSNSRQHRKTILANKVLSVDDIADKVKLAFAERSICDRISFARREPASRTACQPFREISSKLAIWLQQDTFSESGLSEKHAELRVFPAIFSGKPQGFSAFETTWRRTQSRANPSPPKFPANREKYRDFRQFSRLNFVGIDCNPVVFFDFGYESQFQPLNRTGNYQGRIRELNSSLLGPAQSSGCFIPSSAGGPHEECSNCKSHPRVSGTVQASCRGRRSTDNSYRAR
jgi:hypothetical protein